MSTQIKRSELSEVAKELNQVMGLEPEIDIKTKIKELKQGIMEAGQYVDPQEDEFTENTWTILESLGAAFRPAQEYVPDRSGEQAEEEVNDDQESTGDDRNMAEAKKDLDRDRDEDEQEFDQVDKEGLEDQPIDEETKKKSSEQQKVINKSNKKSRKEQNHKIRSKINSKIRKNETDQVKLFIEEIKIQALKMTEIKKVDWNTKGATFNVPLRILVEKGLVEKDENHHIIWKGDKDYNIRRKGQKIIY